MLWTCTTYGTIVGMGTVHRAAGCRRERGGARSRSPRKGDKHVRCVLEKFSRIVLVASGVAAMTLSMSPGAALAAKGGKNSTQAVTLAVTPNPASPYSYVQVGGCGYAPNKGVVLGVQSPTA